MNIMQKHKKCNTISQLENKSWKHISLVIYQHDISQKYELTFLLHQVFFFNVFEDFVKFLLNILAPRKI